MSDLINLNGTLESLESFKKYLESKKHFVTDDKLLKEMESHVSEYVEFKLFKKDNLD